MDSIRYRHVMNAARGAMALLALALMACSGGDDADFGSQCGGAPVASSTAEATAGGGSGGEGGLASATSSTTAVSAPPPAWGPPAWSACLPHGIVTTCAAYCASYSLSCSTSCQSPYTGKLVGAMTFNNETCTSYFPGGTSCDADIYTADSARCCCGI